MILLQRADIKNGANVPARDVVDEAGFRERWVELYYR